MLSDEEILAKDYGYWGNIRKRSLYEYRPGEWGLLQDMDRLEYYLEKVNADYIAKEKGINNSICFSVINWILWIYFRNNRF